MVVLELLGWWYGVGWLALMRRMSGNVQTVLGLFSVGQLFGSLFAPFRQISAGRVQGPLGVRFRAWGDRVFSRGIGAVVRTILIVVGIISAVVSTLWGLAVLLVWPLLPLLPFTGLLLMLSGYIL
jgi:hypothetical protein